MVVDGRDTSTPPPSRRQSHDHRTRSCRASAAAPRPAGASAGAVPVQGLVRERRGTPEGQKSGALRLPNFRHLGRPHLSRPKKNLRNHLKFWRYLRGILQNPHAFVAVVVDHVAATHGILVGDGIESFDDWLDYGAITSFTLIRPHDERSSMMTVRTKFAGEGCYRRKGIRQSARSCLHLLASQRRYRLFVKRKCERPGGRHCLKYSV